MAEAIIPARIGGVSAQVALRSVSTGAGNVAVAFDGKLLGMVRAGMLHLSPGAAETLATFLLNAVAEHNATMIAAERMSRPRSTEPPADPLLPL